MVRAISPCLGSTVCTTTGGAVFGGASDGDRLQPASVARATRVAKSLRAEDRVFGRRRKQVRLKSEGRTGLDTLGSWNGTIAVHSDFGLRVSFGPRPSTFGLRIATC